MRKHKEAIVRDLKQLADLLERTADEDRTSLEFIMHAVKHAADDVFDSCLSGLA